VKQSDGAIGYVELIYAISNICPTGREERGRPVRVGLASRGVSAAAAEKLRIRIPTSGIDHQSEAGGGLPHLLVHLAADPAPAARSRQGGRVEEVHGWMLQPEAQRMAADLHYAPLPVPVIELVQQRLAAK
jgi:ABC-type phosphate transport system substrate-binding protein